MLPHHAVKLPLPETHALGGMVPGPREIRPGGPSAHRNGPAGTLHLLTPARPDVERDRLRRLTQAAASARAHLLAGDAHAALACLDAELIDHPPGAPSEAAWARLTAALLADPDDALSMGPQVRVVIRTLGRFEVLVDGEPLCGGRKQPRRALALLKALIALGGQNVCRSSLADMLWPDLDGDMAQNALEVTLHRLRKRIRVQDAIQVRTGCLSLNPERVWIDALALDGAELDRQPDSAGEQAPGAARDAMQLAARALRLYRGPFLPDERECAWSMRTRERVRARFVRIVAEAGRALEAEGRLDSAAGLYERALEVDDFAQVLHDGLIRCLTRHSAA